MPDIDSFISDDTRDSFDELFELLKLENVNIVRDKKLVRGLDYYSGTCFEMKCTHDKVMDVLGLNNNTCLAGGRYDGLAERSFGKKT